MGQDGSARHPPCADELTSDLVTAVADARGVDPLDLDQRLNEAVDPDALWHLFAPRQNGASRTGGQVQFSLADCEVTVYGDRSFEVEPPATSNAAAD